MIDHVWTVFCARASIDQRTNNVSLFEVIEQLAVQGPDPPPTNLALPVQAQLVTLWSRSLPAQPARGFALVHWLAPSGERFSLGGEQDINLTTAERVRMIGDINALSTPVAGRYSFVVEFRQAENEPWREVGRVPVQVDFDLA